MLFIVEGTTDETALEAIFKCIYKRNKNIEFRFTHGDLSSDETSTQHNIEERIHNVVLEFMKDKKLKASDIFQIVQIFDTDGAYIPNEAICIGQTVDFKYSTTNISCKDISRVIERNIHKKEIMDYLLQNVKTIKSIPYTMYFMSCNLDHALYNEISLDKDLKQEYADRFYEKFLGKEYLFVDFLKSDVVNGVPSSFIGSWNYIKEDLHSLERHTNLHIYFSLNPLPDGLL